jgi:two-component system nitrogen regulation response regulator GlnG/two-component system response regulator HydG
MKIRDDGTTRSDDDAPDDGPSSIAQDRLALVLLWSKSEPWRIGEGFFLPTEAESTVWFGRGSNAPGAPCKATLGQQRPGHWGPCPLIVAPAISRYQVSFRRVGAGYAARNEGKCSLLRNGVETTDCELTRGDLLQIGKQFLFLCCLRPERIPGQEGEYPPFAFGEPDRYGIVGESPDMWRLRRQIVFAATRPDHTLVEGRSGSGKELVAAAIHGLSSRGGRRMVSRNAATLPETLIDAELFGNAKSYPNPGMAARPGLVGEAHGSTLFLDELAELPHAAQAHLLRVLDRGEYQRLGDAQVRMSDFRVIAATNRDPSSLKPDLLARFTLRIAVPDLNSRKEDVPLLARHLLRRMAERGDSAALALFPGQDPRAEPRVPLPWMIGLLEHPFLTNVRELEAMLVAALATPEVARPWAKAEGDVRRPELYVPDGGHVDAVSAEAIRQCLDANNGSIERTWRALGLSSRFALLRLIKKHGLEVRRRPSLG